MKTSDPVEYMVIYTFTRLINTTWRDNRATLHKYKPKIPIIYVSHSRES
jgi:hypothetical protein